MKLAVVGIVCVALLAVLLCVDLRTEPGVGPPRSAATARGVDSGPVARGEDLVSPTSVTPRVADDRAQAPRDSHTTIPAPSDADLIAILAAIGSAEARGEDGQLAARLPEVVGRGRDLLATLDLLEAGRLVSIPHARRGALVVLSVGAARWSRGGGPGDVDGVLWTTELLLRLPRLDEDTRAELVTRIAGAEVEGRGVLDGRYLAVVLDLCREHAEDAPVYTTLLDRISDDIESLRPHVAVLRAALSAPNAAAVRSLALRVLFALEPTAALSSALELVAAARGDSELRVGIARAIASAAPPEQAVELLLELRDPSQYGAFSELAARPGAGGILRDHYNRLAAAGTDSIGRRILVASMRAEDPATLFGIAETDPSVEVRQQAFLTGTLRPAEDPYGVQALRTAYERRTDAALGVPTRGVVIAADNVVLNSRGPRRDAALSLMEDIARDPASELADRLFALRRLRPYVPAERIADLDSLGETTDPFEALPLNQAVK